MTKNGSANIVDMTTLETIEAILRSGAVLWDLRRLVEKAEQHGIDVVKAATVKPYSAVFVNVDWESWPPDEAVAGMAIVANRFRSGAVTMICGNITRRTLAASPIFWPYLRRCEDLEGGGGVIGICG